MTFTNNWPARAFTIKSGAAVPQYIVVKGRDGWALEALIAQGPKGCTSINNPGPRWAAYVHKLRKLGVTIDTITETHDGPFAGHNARYVLARTITACREGGAA